MHGINDNKLIPHLSYLGVYQDEVKTRDLYKEINIYIWGWNQTPQNTDKKMLHVCLPKMGIKNILSTAFLNWCSV